MSKLAKNIAHLRKLKDFTQEGFADELDIKKSRLGAYEEGRSSPPIDILIRLSDYFKLPVDVLIRRDLTKSEDGAYIEIGNQRVLFPITINSDDRELIEVVEAKASAGYTEGYGDPEYIEELPTMSLPFIPHGKYRAFPIKGDSMPPLTDGSYVVGKFIEHPDQIKNGTTYVLVTHSEGIVYKRVYHADDELTLFSDNTFYKPYHIPRSDIMEIWEFACSIHTREFENDTIDNQTILRAIQKLQHDVEALRR